MQKNILLLFIPIIIIYLFALPIPPMEMDAAQYAAMTLEMLEKGDWLHFTDLGVPYLDKPPLVFWLAGISYKLFGISPISYKLPSLIFFLSALWSIYRFAKLYYNENVALTASIVLATSQAAFLMTNDCRTDTLLTGAVAFSIWQLAAYWETRKIIYFIGAFVGIGLAMLAKGPIGIMIPIWAFGVHFLFTKQWKAFFHWQWLAGIAIILLVLSPMLWGLYTQFDLHPELVVNGKTGISGLRFYFWTQSFGRITGESTWENNTGYDFFVHTTLWAFLPWAIFLFVAVFARFRAIAQTIKDTKQEWISLGGFVLSFLAFSASHYKLPHYIFVAYPMGAILVALYIEKMLNTKGRFFWFCIQNIIGIGLFITAFLVCGWVFYSLFFLFLCSILFIIYLLSVRASYVWLKTGKEIPLYSFFPFLLPSLIMMISINTITNLHFYPTLLTYQSSVAVGKYIRDNQLPNDRIYMVFFYSSPDIYFGKRIHSFHQDFADELTKEAPIYIYAPLFYTQVLQETGKNIQVLSTFDDYPVTQLSLTFLNPNTRSTVLNKRVLIKLSQNEARDLSPH